MHVGLIPDGHRRYAEENNINNREAYLKSQERVFDIVKRFNRKKEDIDDFEDKYSKLIDEVTVYALSEDNLSREEEELEIFYSALDEYFETLLKGNKIDSDELEKINIKFISTRREALPDNIKEKAKSIESKFNGDELTLNILLCYDGRKEISQAAENINSSDPEEIWDNLLLDNKIDFVLRTGDNPYRECLSGFPIWQSSYSEYYHIDKNFPDLKMEDVEDSINHYQKLRRKKGT